MGTHLWNEFRSFLDARQFEMTNRSRNMSMVHSARLNGHEPHAYLKDVLKRLPTQPASRIAELLPHRWTT